MPRPFELPPELPLASQDGRTFPSLVHLMRRLLAPDGCAWDREQTLTTLRRYLIEESCEVADALDAGDRKALEEELGDLALQIVFLSELTLREGSFGIDDVVRGIVTKLVRRHPHVFGSDGARPADAAEVEAQWEQLKAQEKRNRPLLDDIPRSLPALDGARRLSERAASVGFDWDDEKGSRAKVVEEFAELDEAIAERNQAHIEHELGDVLFALVNLARHLGIDPEGALRKTSTRFRSRFGHVEAEVRRVHGDWPREGVRATRGIPLGELDSYWNDAKKRES